MIIFISCFYFLVVSLNNWTLNFNKSQRICWNKCIYWPTNFDFRFWLGISFKKKKHLSNNFIDSLIELWIMKSLLCIKRNILSWKTVNFHIICVLHFLSLFPVVGRGYGYFQCGTIFIWTYIFVLFVCLRLYFFHFPLFVFCSCFSIQFQRVFILVPFISFRFCLLHFPF